MAARAENPAQRHDGKGNFTLRPPADLPAAWHALRGNLNERFAEAFWPCTTELAVIVTRARDGTTATSPAVETVQHHPICHSGPAPAAIAPALAAHQPGMVASHTPLPACGVPVASKRLKGLDSLLSLVQMPGGIPGPPSPSAARATPVGLRSPFWPPPIRRASRSRSQPGATSPPIPAAAAAPGRPRASTPPPSAQFFSAPEIPFEFPGVSALMPPCR